MASVLRAFKAHLKGQNSYHLLNLLPAENELTWMTLDSLPFTYAAPDGLLIGRLHGSQVLAYCIQNGDKPREVRFCLKAPDSSELSNLTADEVSDGDLISPFKYINGSSKSEKRKMSNFVKYFFLKKGLIDDISGSQGEFNKRMHGSLRTIAEGKRAESHANDGDENGDRNGEDGSARGEKTARELRSAARHAPHHDSTPTPKPSRQGHKSDYHILTEYLEEREVIHLLNNIPQAVEMRFEEQHLFTENAQPVKLFVGTHRTSGASVYAYMLKGTRKYHEIHFYTEDDLHVPERITSAIAAVQDLARPFDKTGKNANTIDDQESLARLMLIIKWYFLASGTARNVVLNETKSFPSRFRIILEHIAKRMRYAGGQHNNQEEEEHNGEYDEDQEDAQEGAEEGEQEELQEELQAELQEEAHDEEEEGAREHDKPSETPLDEAQIQSALGQDASFSDEIPNNANNNNNDEAGAGGGGNSDKQAPLSPQTQQPSPPESNVARGQKRKADGITSPDADELQRLLNTDRELSKQINALDEEYDEIDRRLQAILNKRQKLDDQRKKNRDAFRRRSLQFT